MKNAVRAMVWGVVLVATAFVGIAAAAPVSKVKVAVIEFTPGPNAGAMMTHGIKRQLQASIAFALYKTKRFDVVDVRHTRDASQSALEAINTESSTAAAVKVGLALGVSHVLTGTVPEYAATANGGTGSATLQTRLVEVATGQVTHSGEIAQQSSSPMRTTGAAEMQTKVLKPAIEQLAESLARQF